jgi:hypothetical protein
MDFGVLLAVLIGSGLGYWFFAANKSILMHMFANFRLLTDTPYLHRRIEQLQSPHVHNDLRYHLELLPAEQHYKAMDLAHRLVSPALKATYQVQAKYLAQYLAILAVIPTVIFIFIGTAHYVLAGLLLAAVLSVFYYAFFVWQPGKMNFEQYKTILMHAYIAAGFRTNAVTENQLDTPKPTPAPDPFLALYSNPYTAAQPARESAMEPLYAMNPLATQPAVASAPSIAVSQSNVDDDEFDPNVARLMHPVEEYVPRWKRLTFNSVWWGANLFVCNIVIISFWFTQARTMVDFIFMPVLLILFVQVFFGPMWLVYKLAQKLIAAEYKR